MIKKYFAISIVAASVFAAGCSSDDNGNDDVVPGEEAPGEETPGTDEGPVTPVATPGVGGTAFDTIANSDVHNTLQAAIEAAQLADTLDDPANAFTIFAPTDAAFTALDNDGDDATPTTADLLNDIPALSRILQFHVVAGDVDSTTVSALITDAGDQPAIAPSILVDGDVTQNLTFTTSDTGNFGIAVNGVDLESVDLVAEADAAGRVHVINSVLIPPPAPEVEEPGEVTPDPDPSGPVVTEGAGTAQAALESAGTFGAFLPIFGGETYDDPVNVWTVFAFTDASIPAGATPDIQNHVFVGGALTEAELLANGEITTNAGNTFPVTGSEGAVLVGGNPISFLATGDGGAIVYSIDGLL